MTATANQQRQQKPETIDEVVSFALAHQTRVQILTVLAEGVHSTEEIAQKIGEPNKRVSHHIKELVERGSIELVEKRPVRNAIQHFYRAIEMPEYSDEEIAAMTPHQRRITAGLVIQSIVAEALAALGAGHLSEDPEMILVSRWFHLDRQGRREVGRGPARRLGALLRDRGGGRESGRHLRRGHRLDDGRAHELRAEPTRAEAPGPLTASDP